MFKIVTLTAAAAFALAAGFAGPASAIDLTNGLIAHWPFDDGSADDQAPADSNDDD